MPRRAKAKVDIDVVPYLSIMVIVLKLICLILIVTVMRLALNPYQKKVISFEGMYQGADAVQRKKLRLQKVPTYIECLPAGVTVYPGPVPLSLSTLHTPTNQLRRILDTVERNGTNEYVIVLLRPNSVPTYRYIRKLLAQRDLDIGYDVLDADAKIDWAKAAKELNIATEKAKK